MYKKIFILLTMTQVYASHEKSLCGADNRVLSTNTKIGRSLASRVARAGCTITMISNRCAVSAGHCVKTFNYAEFNTPISSSQGKIRHSKATDTYRVDRGSITYNNGGIGNDWAVMKIKPNKITGQLPGQVSGFYKVDFKNGNSKISDIVRITGYGADSNTPIGNFAQQTHVGRILKITNNVIHYNVDTMGGNSGSSVIRESDDSIIAIHTHGGCSTNGSGSNQSTYISTNVKFKSAIRKCLDGN
jgi:V8-like Glu-specific endopeptidase